MARTISFVKGKGSLRHNNRDFIANNIDEERISWNKTYIQQSLTDAYEHLFGEAVSEYNAKQKRKDRKIDDYLNKIKNSGNKEKQFYEIVVQIGRRDDTGVVDADRKLTDSAALAKEVLDDYARYFQERNPNLYLFNAVLHMDEATPHLHLDYIPVAHGYKTGLKTRNSLTMALQEQGIEPARARKDNETMHWQERERACLTELCKERGVEIEVLGVDRDDYSIPEYKNAMRAKEAAEAEIEILMAEKIEAESFISSVGEQVIECQEELLEQKTALDEIKQQIVEKQESCKEYEAKLDKILSAKKPVEKEIKTIRSQAVVTKPLLGGEPIVKIPQKTFDKMLEKYLTIGTMENMNSIYEKKISTLQASIDKMTAKVKDLKGIVKKYENFLELRGLSEVFKEFIRPKGVAERLHQNIEIVERKKKSQQKQTEHITSRKNDIAI